MILPKKTEWYPPSERPLYSREGLYEVVEAHPTTPLEEDQVVMAFYGYKLGTIGFWVNEIQPDNHSVWRMLTNILRWRGRQATPRVKLIVTEEESQLQLPLTRPRVPLLKE